MTPPGEHPAGHGADPRAQSWTSEGRHAAPDEPTAIRPPTASGEPGVYRSASHQDAARPAPEVTDQPGVYRSAAVEAEATGTLGAVTDPGGADVLVEPGQGASPDSPDASRASLFRNSAVMAVFTVFSRLLGYVRTAVIGLALGSHAVANAYTNGNYSPLMVYELLLGGILTSVVVPLLVRARKRDPDGGQAYTQRFATLAAVGLAGATALVVLCAPLIALAVAGDRNTGLVVAFSYIMLPAIFFYGFSALFQAILNSRGSFAAPTWAPMLNNLVVIGAFLLFYLLWPSEPTVADMTPAKILLLGLGFTVGIAVQACALLPALRKVGFRWRLRFDFRKLGLGSIGRLGIWAICYVAVSQVGLTVVIHIANAASGPHSPGPRIYDNAFLLMMMCNGIAAVSVMTALMPRMSAAAADHRYSDVGGYLSIGTRMSSVLLIPATTALVVFGAPLGVLLFHYGNYGLQSSLDTGVAIAMAGLGLVPFAISQMQIFAFYAMPDTRTPALANVPVVAVKIVFDLLAMALVPSAHVVPYLLLGNAVSFVVATIISYGLLRRRIGALGLRKVGGTLGRLAGAALVAGLLAYGVVRVLTAEFGHSRGGSLLQLAAGGVVLAVVYFGLALLFRVREVSDVVGMVRAKLGR